MQLYSLRSRLGAHIHINKSEHTKIVATTICQYQPVTFFSKNVFWKILPKCMWMLVILQCACVHVCACVCACRCMYIWVYVCVHVCIYVCMRMCAWTHACISYHVDILNSSKMLSIIYFYSILEAIIFLYYIITLL